MATQWHSQIKGIEKSLDGQIGIYAVNPKRQVDFSLNHDAPFPMASIDKIAIAACCLSLISKQILKIDQVIDIQPTDLRIGTGLLNKRFAIPGVQLSLENLIKLLLETSDNTANDLMLRLIGGPKFVTKWLQEEGINNIDISRTCLQGLAEQMGFNNMPLDQKCTLKQFHEWENSISADIKRKAEENYILDPRDSATPKSIVDLLHLIHSHKLFSQEYSAKMIQFMKHCQTGPGRIRGLLPKDVTVAHKTGSMFGITNDAGIIYSPNNSEILILSVFIKSKSTTLKDNEQVISKIAKIIFDNLLEPKG